MASHSMKARQAEEGKKAMAEYEANAAAVRAKTEKLRALRLAREAADGTQGAAAGKAKKTASAGKAKSGKKKQSPKGTLADWLTEQQNSGRNT